MDRWISFNTANPRKYEIIAVKSESGIYERLLICESSLDFWVYLSEDKERYMNDHFSGTKLSFHGLTHWTLIESPY